MLTSIFALTPLSGNLAVEAAIASVLISQDQQVQFVICDGSRSRCTLDNFMRPGVVRADVCRDCAAGSRAYSSQLALRDASHVDFGTLVDPGARTEAFAEIDALAHDDLFTFTYDGMPFGTWMIDGMRLAYFGENWQRLKDLPQVARGTLGAMVETALAAEAVIHRYRPQTFLILNGLIPCEHVAWAVGRRHGVHTVLYEGGQRPGTVYLSESTPACVYDVTDHWRLWRDVPLTRSESATLDQVMISRMYQAAGGYVYSPSATGNGADARERLGFPPGLPLLVAFTNCSADTSVFAANTVFSQQIEWVDASIGYAAAHPELGLIIRIHPVEETTGSLREGKAITARDKIADGIAERWPDLPANVRVVGGRDPLSSYDLMQISHLVLAYVSTVGIEAAILGRAVINAGSYHYTGKGFTHCPETPDAYLALLDRLAADPQPPPQAGELARRYFYLWLHRSMLPMPNLDVNAAGLLMNLRLRPAADSARGRHASYDRLVGYMRRERPFIDPPAPWRLRDAAAPAPLRFPAQPHLLGVPDWQHLPEFARALLRLAGDRPGTMRVSILSGALTPDEAGRRLVEALLALAPPETWPDIDALPGDLPADELGILLSGADALLVGRRPSFAEPLAAMADHAGVPVIALDDSAAVRSLAHRLQAAAVTADRQA
jgi:hypothetical protein